VSASTLPRSSRDSSRGLTYKENLKSYGATIIKRLSPKAE